ncbi:hypothetical protein J4477_04195 [Candidatus Pacearchaeota archaeon]|nr:hypothetical protein [Candidatus Pacearchaeota archaeon]
MHFCKKINKKAQLGDFLSWASVTIIIFFIMVLFGAAILVLNFQISKNDIQIKEISTNLDYEKTISLINFYKSHYKSFSDWADNPNFLTDSDLGGVTRENQLLGDYSITQAEIEKLVQEKDVLNGFYNSYFKQNNINNAGVYIYTGKKKLLTIYDGESYISNPPKEEFLSDEKNIRVEFFILSKNGNLVGVKYYEDEPLKKVFK